MRERRGKEVNNFGRYCMRREKWKALVMHKMITEVTPGYRPRIFTYGAYTHLKQSLYCSGACLWDKCQKKSKKNWFYWNNLTSYQEGISKFVQSCNTIARGLH